VNISHLNFTSKVCVCVCVSNNVQRCAAQILTGNIAANDVDEK